MRRVNLRGLACAMLFAVVCATSVMTTKAQDEPKRYKEGDIKVGDRVETDPSAMNQWLKCTVTKINYWIVKPTEIDSFTVRCDGSSTTPPRTFQVIADSAHLRPLNAADDKRTDTKAETNVSSTPVDKKPQSSTAKRTSSPVPRGCPTDDEVKQTIQKWLEKKDKQQDPDSKTTIELDSGIQRAGVTRRYIRDIGEKTICPVKVDYTQTTDHPARIEVIHWKDGVYQFFKTSFGEWDFELGNDQPTHTYDNAKSMYKN